MSSSFSARLDSFSAESYMKSGQEIQHTGKNEETITHSKLPQVLHGVPEPARGVVHHLMRLLEHPFLSPDSASAAAPRDSSSTHRVLDVPVLRAIRDELVQLDLLLLFF